MPPARVATAAASGQTGHEDVRLRGSRCAKAQAFVKATGRVRPEYAQCQRQLAGARGGDEIPEYRGAEPLAPKPRVDVDAGEKELEAAIDELVEADLAAFARNDGRRRGIEGLMELALL